MRIAFTGSRHWLNEAQIRAKLLELKQEHGRNLEVCHGGARNGVDEIVGRLCDPDHLDIPYTPFPVRSSLDGNHRGAPLNRNKRMLLTFMPDLLIAFRSVGKSNGTDNTIGHAEKLGIPVEIIPED